MKNLFEDKKLRKNRYRELMKEATSLKKKDITHAIKKLSEALEICDSNQITRTKIRLANYISDYSDSIKILEDELSRIENEYNYIKLFKRKDWQFEGNSYISMIFDALSKVHKKNKNTEKFNFYKLKSNISSLIDITCRGRLCVSKVQIRNKIFFDLSYGFTYDYSEDTLVNDLLLKYFEKNYDKLVYIDKKMNKCMLSDNPFSCYTSMSENKKIKEYISNLQSYDFDDFREDQ